MLYLDKPIENINEDLLKRGNFSKNLADSILSYSNEGTFTIGLCGKWGCGKTSIINLTLNEINNSVADMDDDRKPIIIRFNPWNYSDKSQLITEFFKTLLSLFGLNPNKDFKKIGEEIQKYSVLIEPLTYIPTAGSLFGLFKFIIHQIGGYFSKKSIKYNSLYYQKEKVIEALKTQKHKFLIIIDDIDRLNNEQIKLIFQLVNSIAGFPNMIYLLSFDKDIVANALSNEQHNNGFEYMEKIIQIPFDVPDIDIKMIQNIFFNHLEKIITKDIKYNNFDNSHWSVVFNKCISPFIKDIRCINRILNSYQFYYDSLKYETNCIDLLAITVIKIYAPEIYIWIKDNISDLVGTSSSVITGISGVEQKKNKDKYIKIFSSIYKDPEFMSNFIATLFPKFAFINNIYSYNDYTDKEILQKQMISSSKVSELYFTLSFDNVRIPKKEILFSINNLNSKTLREYTKNLVDKQLLNEYIEILTAYVNQIPAINQIIFLKELIFLQTLKENYKSNSPFSVSTSTRCFYCFWDLLNKMDSDKRYTALLDIINDTDLDELPIISNIIYRIANSYGKIDGQTDYNYRVINEKELEKIERLILNKIVKLSKTGNLFFTYSFHLIWRLWNYLDKKSCDYYVISSLNQPENAPIYISMPGRHKRWDTYNDEGLFFDENDFLEHTTKTHLYNQIISLKNTPQFSNLEHLYKEFAISYCAWYENTDKEKRISKTEVNKIIPLWENL